MCITEYNEKAFVNGIRAEGVEEGRKREIFNSVLEGDYDVNRGAQKLGISVNDFCEEMEKAGFKVPAMA